MTEGRQKRNRRASRPAVPGTDPHPSQTTTAIGADKAAEDKGISWGEIPAADKTATSSAGANDERLKRDRPPHWG